MIWGPNQLLGDPVNGTSCSQTCGLRKMGFIDDLRRRDGPVRHDSSLDYPISASTHSFLSSDVSRLFGACLDISNNGMALLSAQDVIRDEVVRNEAELS